MTRQVQKNHVVIGIDSSTTATKAVAWDGCGRVAATGRCAIDTHSPAPGWAEQDPADWWTSTVTAVRHCVAELGTLPVVALGLTVQRETFALLDHDMEPVRPAILWYDTRGESELNAIAEAVDPNRYHRLTGKQLDATAALPKMRWLRQHTDIGRERSVEHFVDVMAYLAWCMTGCASTTPAGVDTTGLLTLEDATWHGAYLQLAGLHPDRMPVLVPPGDLLGRLTASAAQAMGLTAGLPLVAGGGDGHCFAFGARALCGDALTISLGTSAVLSTATESPVLSNRYRTLIGCEPGTFYLESVLQCGTATVDWLNRVFPGSEFPTITLEQADAQAACLPVGADGLLVLPHWRGVRLPEHDATARGVALGWHDRHTGAHFHRAILEGIALELAALVEEGERDCGPDRLPLVVGGGGAASDLWCQILADCFRRPCLRVPTVEVAAFGAAELARRYAYRSTGKRATGIPSVEITTFRPDPDRAARYAAMRPLLTKLYAGTRSVQAALDQILEGP